MTTPTASPELKVFVFAASHRAESLNGKLAALAGRMAGRGRARRQISRRSRISSCRSTTAMSRRPAGSRRAQKSSGAA